MGAPDRRLTANFRLWEFLRSQTARNHGIDMTPPASVIRNLQLLCEICLQPMRDRLLDHSIVIDSSYRPPKLNAILGGSTNSRHLFGLGADIHAPGLTPYELALEIALAGKMGHIQFEKVILEYGDWVHIQIADPADGARENKVIALTARKVGDETEYQTGIQNVLPLAA